MKKPNLDFKRPQFSRKRSSGSKPGVKPPKFVADLYADLRDRRLLPLVALLLVAIVATPILLAGGSEEEAIPPTVAPPATASAAQASFAVVPAEPNKLRDYHERLGHRTARNPFRAPPQPAEASAATTGGEGSGEAVAGSEVEAGATEYSPAEPPVVKATVKATIDVAALLKTEFIGAEPKEQRVESQTKLPNEKNPAVVYTGVSPDKTGGIFLMTSNVTAFYGHGQCVLGGATGCQQIKLKIGKSATFAIGYGETRYKITMRGFVPIVREAKVERGG